MSDGQYNQAWERQTRNDNLAAQVARLQTKLASARILLDEVFKDSGFRNLHEPLQDRISDELNKG